MVPELESTGAKVPQDEPLGVLPPGTLLHGFEIKSVLGQGGFGITYRARDIKLERDVAIKEFLPTALALRHEGTRVAPRSTDVLEDFVWGRERFLDEARTLARLEGAPAVVRVIDFLEANGTAYTVMALARGQSLDRLIRASGPLTPSQVDRLLVPLLAGLERVHAAGFLHRDIKPANIIVDEDGAPTLIDFGASRAAISGRSHTMTAIFTPGYAAAEQMTSARQGPWTDIYALSATVYHAITGGVPPSAFDRILHDSCELLTDLRPEGFRASLLAGIDRGLSVRAEARPQSVAEWRPMLEGSGPKALSGSSDVTVAVRHPPQAPRTAPRDAISSPPAATSAEPVRRRPWILAGIAALVLIAAGAVYSKRSLFMGTTVESMTAEELSRALDERRKADAAATEKKRLEDQARARADADAEAKRKAEEDLAIAQQQRQKAEEELAALKADIARREAEESQRSQAATEAQRALDEAALKKRIEAETAALRKADEEAKAKAAAERAARAKAAAEAESKRKADEALARAQAERLQAEAEAARQKAELEERQRRDSEAKAKAEAEARAKADAEAKAKAEAEARAKAEADAEAAKKAAEGAESALKLSLVDRQRLQIALSAAGFDTRGNDGSFGARSREMIAAWQKSQGQPATGFLTASQQQALLKNGAAAIRKFDDDQKKIEDDKRKAEEDARKKVEEDRRAALEAKQKADEEARKKAAAATPPPTAPTPAPPRSPANINVRTRPNTEVLVNWHGNWDQNCVALPRPTVVLATPPGNGTVQFRPVIQKPANCGKPMEVTGIYYTPNAGFTGVDRFSFERKPDVFNRSAAGTRTVAVDVR